MAGGVRLADVLRETAIHEIMRATYGQHAAAERIMWPHILDGGTAIVENLNRRCPRSMPFVS